MKYAVTVTGDINDGDYTSNTNIVDLDERLFDSDEFENITITYKDFLEAFGKAIKTCNFSHYANFLEEHQYKIFEKVCDMLELNKEVVSPDILHEIAYDFLPMSADYPIHTITSIVAIPSDNLIKFY